MKKAALISVFDKTGVVELAQSLSESGYVILSSSGTAKHLKENNVEVTLVEDYTGQVEILGGRVKTLHPKVHAGLLAKRTEEQIKDLESIDAYQIDILAVNLYPFLENLEGDAAADPIKMVELIDIGGPAMLRAAAKNFNYVYSLVDPSDYDALLDVLKSEDEGRKLNFRQVLATKVFATLANYNLAIANYFSKEDQDSKFANYEGHVLEKIQSLRYGENPHQQANFYADLNSKQLPWEQLGGKELSYNNLLDFEAAASCISGMKSDDHTCVIIKHLNPCGAANSKAQVGSLVKAKKSDPRSHFGGIIAFNKQVESDTAHEIIKDFTEIVLAPDFSPEAYDVLSKKSNLRVIKIDYSKLAKSEFRSCVGGVLMQDSDYAVSTIEEAELVSEREVSDQEKADLAFAWQICRSVKSNAIALAKDQHLLATGAGQMSRIDSVELAISKANTHGHDLKGAVAASDAFFPFTDNIETLAKAGITAIIVTGGSKGDETVIEKAKELGISLLFTKDRHFKH